jgi:hypothetical protein
LVQSAYWVWPRYLNETAKSARLSPGKKFPETSTLCSTKGNLVGLQITEDSRDRGSRRAGLSLATRMLPFHYTGVQGLVDK